MPVSTRIVRLLNRVPASAASAFRTDSRIATVLRPVVNRLLPAGWTWVSVRSGPGQGIRLQIDPKREKLFWTGLHETAVQRALVGELQEGMTFWDVGAQIGFFSLLASRLVGENGHVHAFEPMPQNRERLTAALEENGAANVTIHGLALSATAGKAILYPNESAAMWSLAPTQDGDGVEVECDTLDQIARRLPPPDVVKIDAEGMEVAVLRGGPELLRSSGPSVIVELGREELLDEVRALLPSYAPRRLDDTHWLLSKRFSVSVRSSPSEPK